MLLHGRLLNPSESSMSFLQKRSSPGPVTGFAVFVAGSGSWQAKRNNCPKNIYEVMSNVYAPTCQFRQLGCNKNNALIYKLHILHVIDVTLRHLKTLRFICLQISPQINSNIRNIYNLQTWHVRMAC